MPDLPIPHRTLELLLPGFTWISAGMFVLGLVEALLFGAYAGWLLVVIHNFFQHRMEAARSTTPDSKAA